MSITLTPVKIKVIRLQTMAITVKPLQEALLAISQTSVVKS